MTEQELLAQPGEAYMSEAQQAYFRALLLDQRDQLQGRIDEEFRALQDSERASDDADVASREESRQWQLRLLEREKKLLDKIDQALERADVALYSAKQAGRNRVSFSPPPASA